MFDNNKIIVSLSGETAAKHIKLTRWFSSTIRVQIEIINDEILPYFDIPKYLIINEVLVDEDKITYGKYFDSSSAPNCFDLQYGKNIYLNFEFETEEEALYFKMKFCS